MAQMPITAVESGVKRVLNTVDQRHVPQPQMPSQAAADHSSRRDFFIAALASAGIAAHLVLRYGFRTSSLTQFVPLYLTLIVGGLPLIVHLLRRIFAHEF